MASISPRKLSVAEFSNLRAQLAMLWHAAYDTTGIGGFGAADRFAVTRGRCRSTREQRNAKAGMLAASPGYDAPTTHRRRLRK